MMKVEGEGGKASAAETFALCTYVSVVAYVAHHQMLRPRLSTYLALRILRYPLVSIRSDVVRETLYPSYVFVVRSLSFPAPHSVSLNNVGHRLMRKAENFQ